MDTSKEDMFCQDDAMQIDFFKLEEDLEEAGKESVTWQNEAIKHEMQECCEELHKENTMQKKYDSMKASKEDDSFQNIALPKRLCVEA